MTYVSALHPTPGRLTIAGAEVSSGGVVVSWADGHKSRFPAIWLRHNCSCDLCGSTETARRHLRFTDISSDATARQIAVDGSGALHVAWGPGGHTSSYPAAWLRGHCLSASEREHRRFKPKIWQPESDGLIHYERFPELGDDKARLRYLERLRDYGFAILTDVDAAQNATEAVAATVGLLRITNYGVYELISRPSPQLAGDTSLALAPHTDEPYRHSPPGITFFHVIAQSEHGGDSTLVDGLYLAEKIRSEDPNAFKLLSTIPVNFHRVLQEGRIFQAAGPIISVDREGNVEGVRLLDRGTAPFDLDEDMVVPFYAAYKRLLSLLYDEANYLVVKIQPGEVLVFNNQRLLHGRTAFDATKSFRHVRSANVDLDEFYSSLRILYRKLGREELYMRLPQGASA
jgi:gamma-butyrobetaine dioxygenase